MKRAWLAIAVLCMSSLLPILGLSQRTAVTMDDLNTSLCEANFFDSELGPGAPGRYDHNETYTLRICIPGADSIVMVFSEFSSEPMLDLISFFDGPDHLTSPPIGPPHSGNTIPGPIVAVSGCLTVRWESDASINADGWVAEWFSIINEPILPEVVDIPNTNCGVDSFRIHLDQALSCDSLVTAFVNIFGPQSVHATSIEPVDCVNDSTRVIQVNLNQPIETSGTYNVDFTAVFLDACQTPWELTTFGDFEVNDCPIEVELIATDTLLCFGECGSVTAIATGGDSSTYQYQWTPGLPATAGPHFGCPSATTTYRVTVSDAGQSPPGTAQLTVVVIPLPQTPADTTVCQSEPSFDFVGTPAGGGWFGDGIIDTLNGTFYADTVGPGQHQIWYRLNGCADTMTVTVLPMDAGPDEASCPGAPVFAMSGFDPPGGIWSGPFIDSAGNFTPTTPGVYSVQYTIPGCPPDGKFVSVDQISIVPVDTLCERESDFDLEATPEGGTWSGPGIRDSETGRFRARDAGAGDHLIFYDINGCRDTLNIHIIEIFAGWDINACPTQDTIQLDGNYPPGGQWYGDGVIDSSGLFQGDGLYNARVYYTVNGCVDERWVYVRETVIYVDPMPSTCPFDTIVHLTWPVVQRAPSNGNWRGPGIVDSSNNGRFDPSVAGPGVHTLYYVANTCIDSTTVEVFEHPQIRDTAVCIEQSPFTLPVDIPGGIWSGSGISNPFTGLFDAAAAGLGQFNIDYVSPDGCLDSLVMTVEPLAVVSIDGLDAEYCFKDTNVVLTGNPPGGRWSGPLIAPGNVFNPAIAGAGVHNFTYTVGTGDCAVTEPVSTLVGDPIEITMPFYDTVICDLGILRLEATAVGGDELSYSFTWNNGIGGTGQLVEPDSSQTYFVVVEDGCSDPDTAFVNVGVLQEIVLSFDTSAIQCFGGTGFVEVSADPPLTFAYQWNTDPPEFTSRINGVAGLSYEVTVTDQQTGCEAIAAIRIPSFERIVANFNISPNVECLTLLNPEVQLINQSVGGTRGTWDFGDGWRENFEPLGNPIHTYEDTGTYTVILSIANDGGCSDQFSLDLCIESESLVYVPSVFTPNGDGENDVLIIYGVGLEDFQMLIFNRWGEVVFETNDQNRGWDARYKFEPVPVGGYPYVIKFRNPTNNRQETVTGMVMVIR